MKKVNTENAYDAYIGKGIKLTSEYEKVEALSTSEYTMAEGIKFRWVQGGCTDGKNYYCFMITDHSICPAKAVILKYDLETQTLLQQSQIIVLGHSNDAAYNPYNNTITVINGGESHIVLDADTFEIVKYVPAEYSSGVVSYDPDEHLYMIGDNYTFCFYDDDFNLLKKLPIEGMLAEYDKEKGLCGSQGMTRDKNYMYYLENWINKEDKTDQRCNIVVYDVHTLEYIERIPLHMGLEVEHIFIWNNSFYITCNNIDWNRAYCYKVKVVPQN